ncbi:MAG TPA: amidase [Armatimonadota bacterium]|nr:amidase [Armatimonadota bacterium]
MSELADLSLAELSGEIRAGRVSPLEATEACLERIRERDRELNAFLTLCEDAARADARRLGEELSAGLYRGPLHGVPVGIKDLFQTRGVRTTAGSRILADWVPDEDATVVRRLREAGAVILGKLGTHEFAYGATGANPHYGPVRNPHDPARITGGSSSGSAAAVAAGMCYAALGSDTGGSIRCPAALCGIVGLKPTYGLAPRTGVVPLAWSLDHVGPMTRTAADAGLVLEVIAGPDPGDPTSLSGPRFSAPEGPAELEGVRLGIPREWFFDAGHPGVVRRFREAVAVLEGAGARVEEVSIPALEFASAAQNTIIAAEATAYHRGYLRGRADEYSESVRLRLLQGLFISAAEYLDAQRARRIVRRELLECLRNVDALITPTVAITAPRIDQAWVEAGDLAGPPQAFMVRSTFPFNLTGLPALSVPCGTSEGMPVGLQIAGRPMEDARLLALAAAYEQLRDG